MLDITPFLDIRPAPAAVFDRARASPRAPRFRRRRGGAWQPVTWGQFAEQIAQVSLFLPGVGVDLGDRAAVFGDNSVEWAAAALGIQAAGGVAVPIAASSTAEQAGYALEHADVKVLFVASQDQLRRVFDAWPRCAGVAYIVLMGDIDVAIALAAADPEVRPEPDDIDARLRPWPAVMQTSVDPGTVDVRLDAIDLDAPALMLYTRGSTGRPKGVPLTHNNLGHSARGWLEHSRHDLHDGAVDLLCLPMSHIAGFHAMCLGNTLGFDSYLCDPDDVLDCLPEVRPSVLFAPPAQWDQLAGAAGEGGGGPGSTPSLAQLTGGGLRLCVCAGAGLEPAVKERFHGAGVLIIDGYGVTECGPALTLNSREGFRFDSAGTPLSNLEVRVADDGEIQTRGANVFAGYHKNPEATRAAFTGDGWFRTGDRGRITDDGFLQILGRTR